MGLYRQRGSEFWWMSVSQNGRRIRRSTGTSNKKLAEKIYAKVKTQLIEGKWFGLDESKVRTLKELADRYIKERSPLKSPQSYRRDEGVFKHMLSFFGDCLLADITPRAVNDYKNMRLQLVDGQTVKKELGILRNALNVAIKEWEWVQNNPVSRISLPKDPPGRVRFLTQEEIGRLIDCANNWFKPVIIVAVYTGLREGNIISLTWEKINLFKRSIVLSASEMKNDESLCIPINDTLFETLKDLQKVRYLDSNLVFMRNGRPLYKKLIERALKKACKQARITDFRFHDLRHTFASMLVESGVDLYTVQKLLGHKDGRMTQRYAHLTQDKLIRAVKVLDNSHNFVIVREGERGVEPVTP